MSKGKEPRHYVLHCEPGKYEIQGGEVTFWTQRRYDRRWHDDAVKEASREGADARRREIIFAVCLAESYLFEWVATVVQREYPGARKAVEQYWTESVTKKWKKVPKILSKDGMLRQRPDLGGPRGKEWKRLVNCRNGLVHAKASLAYSPDMDPKDPERPVPTYQDLEELEPGWALGLVVERIRRLHEAAGTSPPEWLSS